MILIDIFNDYILSWFINFETISNESIKLIEFIEVLSLTYIALWVFILLPFKLFKRLVGVK